MSLLVNLMIFVFAGLVIVTGGIRLIGKTLETAQVSAVMQIPMGYVYLILPLSGLVIMFYALNFMCQSLLALKTANVEAL